MILSLAMYFIQKGPIPQAKRVYNAYTPHKHKNEKWLNFP